MNPPAASRGLLERADRLGRRVENSLLAVLLAAMLVIGAAQILLRNFLGGGLNWADEALRLMLLWLAMIGAVAASRDNRHISIDALARVLPPRAASVAAFVAGLFTAGVCFLLAWFSASFVLETREYDDRLLGDLPAWLIQSILPVGFFLIAYRYLIWSLKRLLALLRPGRGR